MINQHSNWLSRFLTWAPVPLIAYRKNLTFVVRFLRWSIHWRKFFQTKIYNAEQGNLYRNSSDFIQTLN